MPSARKTILLVEDEAVIALAEQRQLQAEGYGVVHAPNGESAVELVAAGAAPVDLVLMDIDLGRGIDGTEAARRILATRDIPVLFLSSHIEKELVAKTESITNYGYVVKNSSFTVLDASIKMAFKLFDAKRRIDEQRMRTEAAYEEARVANEDLLATQRELAASEETFRSLFSKSPMGIAYHRMVYGPSGKPVDYRYVDANDSFMRLLGLDPRGKLVTELFPGVENDSFDWIGAYGRVAKTGEDFSAEQRFGPNGRWYDLVAFRSQPDHFAVAFFDVTERKLAEESLELERLRLRNVLEGANIGTWTLNVQTGESSVDGKSLSLLGYEPGELDFTNLETWMGLKHPDDVDRTRTLLEEHVAGLTEYYEYESRMRRKDGSWAWILGRGKVSVWDGGGKPLMMFGVHLDVTERKLAETALRESEERFRSYFDLPMVGITVATPDMRWIKVNPGFARMLGYAQHELLGRTWGDFTHPDDVQENAELSRKVLQGELDGFTMEKRYRRKDGSYFWASLSLGGVRDRGGSIEYVVIVTMDIDRFKRA